MWMEGNSLEGSTVDKPTDPWVVETRLPAFNSSAMAAPPPTVHGTSRVEEVTSPIPKTGVASSSSQMGFDANSAQSVASILEEKKQEFSNLNVVDVDSETSVTVNSVFEVAQLEAEII